MAPKISVLLICYNDKKFLADTINSILNQSYKNFELIIYDNGSDDDSDELLKKFVAQDDRVSVITALENFHNGSINFRKLIKAAKGKFIKLFCADDIMLEHCLEVQLDFLEQNKNYLACFGHMGCIDDDGNILKEKHNSVIKSNRFEYINHIFYSYSCVAFPTAMLRKEIYNEKMLDPRLIHLSDIKLWLEILKLGEIKILDQQLVQYRIRNNQGNVSNISQDNKRLQAFIFELHLFYQEFFKFITWDDYLNIFPEAQIFTDRITKKDIDLLPFISAVMLYNSETLKPIHYGVRQNIALLQIFAIINDEKLMKRISQKFGFDYVFLHKLCANFNTGLKINHSRNKRNFLAKLYYKLFARNKYKQLAKSIVKITPQ